jgi:hypothetical protein
VTGQVRRGQVNPADREHLRAWLARFADWEDAAFVVEGFTGWRYVVEELAAAGVVAHLAEPAGTAFARGRKRHAKTDCRHLRMLLAEGQTVPAGPPVLRWRSRPTHGPRPPTTATTPRLRTVATARKILRQACDLAELSGQRFCG